MGGGLEREMRTRQIELGRPDLSAQIQERSRQEKEARSRTRLLCVKLAAEGEHRAARARNPEAVCDGVAMAKKSRRGAARAAAHAPRA